ncbi:MAG TPA: hypothetical protein VG842_00790 [Sediminibacterium sp.]|nr:hypothetical protein [Sediminibacterium sp.]
MAKKAQQNISLAYVFALADHQLSHFPYPLERESGSMDSYS